MTYEKPKNGSDRGIGAVLRDLFESIVEAEEGKRTHGQGHSPVGRGRIGYEFSIGLGTLDSAGEDRNRSERQRVRETETDLEANDYVASVSEADGEMIVVVDLPGVDPETLSAGVNSRTTTLIIADDTGIIERVSLPQRELTIADASFNNNILELRLREGDE